MFQDPQMLQMMSDPNIINQAMNMMQSGNMPDMGGLGNLGGLGGFGGLGQQ